MTVGTLNSKINFNYLEIKSSEVAATMATYYPVAKYILADLKTTNQMTVCCEAIYSTVW